MAKARFSCANCPLDFDSFEEWQNHDCDGLDDDDEPQGGGAKAIADGGIDETRWHHLTGFQRDILKAIRSLDARGVESYGLGLKAELEEWWGTEINHGRLYPNLDDLVNKGLVEKSSLDDRTNEYQLTDTGSELLNISLAKQAELLHAIGEHDSSETAPVAGAAGGDD